MRPPKYVILSLAVTIALAVGSAARADRDDDDDDACKLKNVIIMISDGCGYNQALAADYYAAGRANAQRYERFPLRCAMSTYAIDNDYDPDQAWTDWEYPKMKPTDSASAATAMSCGEKTYNAGIGVIGPFDTDYVNGRHLMEEAEALPRRKATGVVSSVEWSHATPAGFVAHNKSRNDYVNIAKEMLYSSACEVIMGCGHPLFDDDGAARTPASESNYKYVGGSATWADLVDGNGLLGTDADGNGTADSWTFIETREQFVALASGPTPQRVCGTARAGTTLQQNRAGDRTADPYAVPFTGSLPTLTEMTLSALNVLDNDPDGFVLMVEGGAIDWASHANQSGRTIEEHLEFCDAVDAVLAWVSRESNWGETLLIVTGDHETGYLWGPGSGAPATFNPLVSNGKGVLPGMQWGSGDHTNSLIPFYAKGTFAKWFKAYYAGTDSVRGRYIDNTAISKVVVKAMKAKNCGRKELQRD